jgi:hypothetical protein
MKKNLTLSIKIDLKRALSGLGELDEKVKATLDKMGQPVVLSADGSGAIDEANDVAGEIDGIPDKEATMSADGSDAIDEANDVAGEIEGIPDDKHINITGDSSSAVGSLARLGLAYQGINAIVGLFRRNVSDLITLSNVQEKAENDLYNALKIKGEAADLEIERLKEYASEVQNLTATGDEQSLSLLGLAVNMGIVSEKREEALEGAIGLAKAYEAAGLTQETAMKGIALAYQGEFTQLQRYIPVLRSAQTDTEKMAILQRNMADGFELAKAETETGAGALEQYQNLVGDLKEKLGDLVKEALLPIVRILSNLAMVLNEHPALFKSVATSIGILVGALVTWKTAQIGLNLALAANPIGIVVTAIAALVAGIVVAIKHIGGFSAAWEYAKVALLITWEYFKAFGDFLIHFGLGAIKVLTYPFTVLQETVKSVFSNISEIMTALFAGDLKTVVEKVKTGFVSGFKEANNSILNSFSTSINAFSGLGKKAEEIWQEAGKAAAEANEKAKEAGEINDGERATSDGKEVLSPAEKQRLEDLARLRQDYNLKMIGEEENRRIAELELQKESELEKARELQASKETLEKIEKVFQDKITKIQTEAEDKRRIEKEEIEKALWEFEQKQLEQTDPHIARLNSQIRATEDWFEKRKEMLLEAGKTEEEIARARTEAIENLEKASMTHRIKMGARGLADMAENLANFGKIGFGLSKTLNMAQVVMETPAAAMAAYKSVVGIPVVGPTLAPIAYAATMAQGVISLKEIASASPPKLERGGILRGRRHSEGGILIEAEDEEYITKRDRVRALGKSVFDFINFAPLDNVKQALGHITIPNMRQIPSPPQFVYASGGAVSGSPGMDANGLVSRLERIEKAIIDKRVDGVFELKDKRTGTERYEVYLRDKEHYERRRR